MSTSAQLVTTAQEELVLTHTLAQLELSLMSWRAHLLWMLSTSLLLEQAHLLPM